MTRMRLDFPEQTIETVDQTASTEELVMLELECRIDESDAVPASDYPVSPSTVVEDRRGSQIDAIARADTSRSAIPPGPDR